MKEAKIFFPETTDFKIESMNVAIALVILLNLGYRQKIQVRGTYLDFFCGGHSSNDNVDDLNWTGLTLSLFAVENVNPAKFPNSSRSFRNRVLGVHLKSSAIRSTNNWFPMDLNHNYSNAIFVKFSIYTQ